jgi:hypothetical protein
VTMIRQVVAAFVVFAVTVSPTLAFQPPAPPEGFVQVEEVPPSEQLPAAPLVIGAYAFFLVLMVAYIWSIGRRLNKVEKEMVALQRSGSTRSGAS